MRDTPDFQFESLAFARGLTRVAGVDEVGRGPLAGPVTAAAVRLDPGRIPAGLRDSKQLSAKRRAELAAEIEAVADVAIAHASVDEIEEVNILRAAERAMARAVARLSRPPDHLMIDGNRIPPEFRGRISVEAIVRGDARSLSIAAASIVAKVARDAIMVDLAQQYPGYGWEHNAGYPTPDHLKALKNLGVTPVHRRSFKPVHNILYQGISITL